jgi:hypothetical protein
MHADLCVNESGDNAVSKHTHFKVLLFIMMLMHTYIYLVLKYVIFSVRLYFILVKFLGYGVYATKLAIKGTCCHRDVKGVWKQ